MCCQTFYVKVLKTCVFPDHADPKPVIYTHFRQKAQVKDESNKDQLFRKLLVVDSDETKLI
jgi:hypothetical protein